MPIYEYACTSCGERTEAKQSFQDPPLQICSICGGNLRKLYSPVGVVFKGSGFYSTDARKPKPSSEPSKTPAKETKSTKTDSKSESSAASKEKSA
jgi:putative FmdB family regulatory protein